MSSSESNSEMGEENIDRPVLLDSGDVRLHFEYSNQSLTLHGSSRALSLASPVWNKILNPPFGSLVSKEGNNNGKQDKHIDFSEDNGEALLILLRIAHLQFSKVPSTLKSFDTLLALAILCDKYDCVGLIKLWLPPWVGNEGTEFKWDEAGYEPWLFIAWVLLRGLQEFDLWPRKSADTIKISVHELALQLQSLGIYVYPTNDFSDHFNCNLVNRFRDQIASTLSSIPNPVLASHRRHMRIQARK